MLPLLALAPEEDSGEDEEGDDDNGDGDGDADFAAGRKAAV